ncbi:nucleotide exchange factor GrpE [Otoolea muris]|uniref:nucleotide exchange factor GrpE n=1 Tax=Otoolea muris TaxID=2941515 RepID=UPI00203FAC40|nr:nucleotide exchange factor GrpE [Otoolea muris]
MKDRETNAGGPEEAQTRRTEEEPGREKACGTRTEDAENDGLEKEQTAAKGAEGADAQGCQEDDPEADSQGGPETGKKKGFFSKKKDKKDEQIEELTDRLKRSMAEFDNYRKRTEKEKSAMYEIGAKDIIEKLLPVVDNFERGLAAVPEGEKTVFADGMDMIYRQLMKMLEDAGVKPIEAAGQPFDPNFHNAVMHVEDESLGENIIAEEFQKGYLYRDSVIRHSMVKVAN